MDVLLWEISDTCEHVPVLDMIFSRWHCKVERERYTL